MNSPRHQGGRLRRWLARLPRRVVITVAVVAAILIGARIALPFVLEHLVNDRLAAMRGYDGSVSDIDVSLLRGAYALNDVSVYRERGPVREAFFAADSIDFSMAWRELWHGKIVSEIYVDRARLNIAKQGVEPAPDPSGKARGREPEFSEDLGPQERREWNDVIEDLFPISITHLVVRDSFLRYTDVTEEPHVDVFLKDMHALATGLRNRSKATDKEFPARVFVKGDTIGNGAIEITAKVEPLAEQPHFHVSVMLEDLHLPALNDSLRAIANVDVGRGRLNLTAEMAAKDGAFEGYVKPFLVDLDYDNLEDRNEGLLTRIWENIVAGLSWVVKNKSRDNIATKIPFEGRFGDSDAGLWATISNLFRHGFVQAFNPTVEGTIQAAQVPNNQENGEERRSTKTPDELRADKLAPTGR